MDKQEKYAIRRKNLARILEAKYDGVQARLADALCREPQYIYGLLSGKKNIGEETARHIERATGEREYSLDGAAHLVLVSPATSGGIQNVRSAEVGYRRVPVISYMQAGDPVEAVDAFAAGTGFEELLTDTKLGRYAFALVVMGNSMVPEFVEGDRVIIDPDVQPNPGDYVVARIDDDDVTFKKYRPRGLSADGKEIFELTPLNSDYASIRSDQVRCTIIGTLVQLIKNYRR